MRTEHEEERFTLESEDEGNQAGCVSLGGETEQKGSGYNWLLYLAPENHKAQGLLQCVS